MACKSRRQRSAQLLGLEEFERRLCLSEVSFAAHEIIVSEACEAASFVSAADVDDDGDVDVFATVGETIAWYENSDGKGSFGPHRIIATVTVPPFDVPGLSAHPADLDNDGDLDIISKHQVGDFFSSIAWYENTDGKGTFGPRQEVDALPSGFGAAVTLVAHPTDVDGDGDVDLLWRYLNRVFWYENTDGKGTFGPIQEVDELSYQAAVPQGLTLADVDGDGDLDAIIPLRGSNFGGTLPGIAWHENTAGKGSFGQQQFNEGPPTIVPVDAADVDGDGDVDIISRTCAHLDGATSQIVWYENTDGNGTFAVFPGQFTGWSEFRNCIDRRVLGGALYAADLDKDGDVDVVSLEDDQIVWYENSDRRGKFGARQIIATTDAGLRSVHLADVDEDGDVDVLVVSGCQNVGGTIVWYENFTTKPGDANRDGTFDQLDIMQVLQSAKYLTGEAATFEEGDWNGNGQFNQLDIVAALQTGNYLQGPYAAIAPGGVLNDDQTSIVYDRVTGEIAVDVPTGMWLQGIVIVSAGETFGECPPQPGFEDCATEIFKVGFGGIVSFSFGNVAQTGLSEAYVLNDLTVTDHNGGGLGEVDLVYRVPYHAGDANRDLQFDQLDIVQVLQAAKYLTGESATFEQGDWNGDGLFDQPDIVAALQTGDYLQGAYAAGRVDEVFASLRA